MYLFKDKRILFSDGLNNYITKGFEEPGAIVASFIYLDYMDRYILGKIKKNFFSNKFSLYEDKVLDEQGIGGLTFYDSSRHSAH